MSALQINYPRIWDSLQCQPWDILPRAHGQLVELLEKHIASGSPIPAGLMEGQLDFGKPRFKSPGVEINDAETVAIVPVSGVLGKRLGFFETVCGGAYDLSWLDRDLDSLSQISTLETVIFDLDTPGGMARPSTDSAEKILKFSESYHTIAYSDLLCASAGYKLAAACNEFYSAKGSEIGCIGTYQVIVDSSQAYKKKGHKVEVVREGKFKAMGYPGKELTEDELAHMRETVAALDSQFKQFCQDQRGGLPSEVLEGQTVGGEEAFEKNLTDGVFASLEDLVSEVL